MKKQQILELAEWLCGNDTGISSETMVKVVLGFKPGKWGFEAPRDPSDFGRCYRLVQRFPYLRKSFAKIGKSCKRFKPILANWDELSAMHEAEFPSGRAPLLYARMKQLLGEE